MPIVNIAENDEDYKAASLAYGEAFDQGFGTPEHEDAISRNAAHSYLYTRYVLKNRFNKGEPAILQSDYKRRYLSFLEFLSTSNNSIMLKLKHDKTEKILQEIMRTLDVDEATQRLIT